MAHVTINVPQLRGARGIYCCFNLFAMHEMEGPNRVSTCFTWISCTGSFPSNKSLLKLGYGALSVDQILWSIFGPFNFLHTLLSSTISVQCLGSASKLWVVYGRAYFDIRHTRTPESSNLLWLRTKAVQRETSWLTRHGQLNLSCRR